MNELIKTGMYFDIKDYALITPVKKMSHEKQAFCVVDNHYGKVCFKLIKDTSSDTGYKQDKREIAVAELKAYQRFVESSVSKHTPTPLGLVLEDGNIVGLVVDWRDGTNLEDIWQTRPLSETTIDQFAGDLLELTKFGFTPTINTYADNNLMVNDSGELWFAECAIAIADLSEIDILRYNNNIETKLRGWKRDCMRK